MKRAYQLVGSALVLLSSVVVWQSIKLKLYSPLGPGAGFFPLCLAAALGVLGMLLVLRPPRESHVASSVDRELPRAAAARRMIVVVVVLTWAVLAMEPLGFRVTMLVFYAVFLWAMGGTGPVTVAAVALTGSFGVYALFADVLGVPLPRGDW